MSDATPAFDAERLIRLNRVNAVVPSPCGTWAAVEVSRLDAEGVKYVADLWRVPLDGGAAVQLTRGASNDHAPSFRRDGALAFLSNRNPRDGKPEEGDEERSQVWLLPTGGGEPRPLTDEPLGVNEFRFARDGDRLLLTTSVYLGIPHQEQRQHDQDRKKKGTSALVYHRTPVRFWDHWLPPTSVHLISYTEAGTERRDLTPDADREHWSAHWDLSADGSRAVITRAVQAADRAEDEDLLLIDLNSDERRLLGTEAMTTLSSPRFSPDGGRIACGHHVRGAEAVGKNDLMVLDLATGEGRVLTEDWDYWPAVQDWLPDGSGILVLADTQATNALFTLNASTGAASRISAVDAGGIHGGVSLVPGRPGRTDAVGWRSRTSHPPEPFRIAVEPGASPELLASLSGLTPEEGSAIAQWEHRRVASTDGVEIQYLVVRPTGASDEPRPTLFWIHGGPIGSWPEGWIWRWNPLIAVSQGYNVILPNPRASTGFGQAHVEGIWKEWGGQVYRDLQHVADDVRRLPDVDADRIAAMGGSFGGYMTNWIGGQEHAFRCLITHASLYSLPAFHGGTDFPTWFGYQIGGTPYAQPEVFDRHSPHTLVSGWKAPTLVIHGEKDYRVPITEGLALFEALQHHGVESELLIFPDENHWILKPRNIVAWNETVYNFLGKHLKSA